MAESKRVIIFHDDGRRYAIPEKAFDDDKAGPESGVSYKAAKFKIESFEDGSDYKAPRKADDK